MPKRSFSFEFVEKQLRKKTFGILGTVSPKGRSHSTGILYGVSPPSSRFSIYALTEKNYIKVRNIENNPNVSFVIPFPHHFYRIIPSSCVQFQGTANILPFDEKEGQVVFSQKRILKMMIDTNNQPDIQENLVFINIKPSRKLFCYGVGMGIMELRKDIEGGSYVVMIPPERL
ncbi:MAG: pyridoxamine 5'-phosphate oxidase family protein [Candidatus Hodarchaeales archaeon]|jgi:nitroimidazol reductase NimA-like FMN-containing flavoprotein (pyridoxamine 5'-phosphate oxidase superfamily)